MNQIEIIARGICIRDNKILLAYFKEKEYYFLPGGHVEFGESVFKALEREMREETGLSATVEDVVLIFEHAWENTDHLVHEMNYVLIYDLGPTMVTPSSTVAHLQFMWISPEQFDGLLFLPKEAKPFVRNILEGDRKMHFFSTMR